MECPHFTGMYMKYCTAEQEMFVPSIHEMREYCTSARHRACRFYAPADNVSENMRNGCEFRSNACANK